MNSVEVLEHMKRIRENAEKRERPRVRELVMSRMIKNGESYSEEEIERIIQGHVDVHVDYYGGLEKEMMNEAGLGDDFPYGGELPEEECPPPFL